MRTNLFKFILFAVCIIFPISLFGQQQIETPKEKPLNLWDVRKTLVFRSPQRESDAEINEKLIAEIRRRKVNFALSEDEEKALEKIGGSDLLIKAIRENLPKEVKEKHKKLEEQQVLYKKYTDNYSGNVEQKKIAIEAAKEFIKKYGDGAGKHDKRIVSNTIMPGILF